MEGDFWRLLEKQTDRDFILNEGKSYVSARSNSYLKNKRKHLQEELISTFTLESVSFPSICYTICKNKAIISI